MSQGAVDMSPRPVATDMQSVAPYASESAASADDAHGRTQRMASALTCPVLDEHFTVDGIYRPYVLPCGHTVSRQALEQVRQCLCFSFKAEVNRDSYRDADAVVSAHVDQRAWIV